MVAFHTHLRYRIRNSKDELILEEHDGKFCVAYMEYTEGWTDDDGQKHKPSYTYCNTEQFEGDYNAAHAAFVKRRDGNPFHVSLDQTNHARLWVKGEKS